MPPRHHHHPCAITPQWYSQPIMPCCRSCLPISPNFSTPDFRRAAPASVRGCTWHKPGQGIKADVTSGYATNFYPSKSDIHRHMGEGLVQTCLLPATLSSLGKLFGPSSTSLNGGGRRPWCSYEAAQDMLGWTLEMTSSDAPFTIFSVSRFAICQTQIFDPLIFC